jgi:DNA-binding SARP family transcriptional activator
VTVARGWYHVVGVGIVISASSRLDQKRIKVCNMFRLRTFGGLTLARSDDGAAVGGPRRKPLAVLALLASAGDAGLSRDRVVSLLWPEDTDERGRRALAQTLYALRREMGQPMIVLGDATLRLDPTIITSDLAEFVEARRRHDHAAAVGACEGPFLDGVHFKGCVEFDRWVEGERARHTRALTESLVRLANEARGAGDAPAAARWLEHAFLADPFERAVALAYVQALRSLGDRAHALRAARLHEELLADDAGAMPTAAWRDTVDALRAGDGVSPLSGVTQRPQAEAPTAPPAAEVLAAGEVGATREESPVVESPTDAPVAAATPSHRWSPRLRRRWLAAGAIIVAMLLVGRRLALPTRLPADGGASSTLGVLPFGTGPLPSALAYVGAGLPQLIDASLAAGGTPLVTVPGAERVVAHDAALAMAARRLARADVRLLAARLRARYLVAGHVTGDAGAVRIRAMVFDGASGTQVGGVDVTGPLDSLGVLVDRLAVGVLARALGEGETRTMGLASVPLPAVQAYLAGREAYLHGRFAEAVNAYGRALDRDSTFALAGFGLALAGGWAGQDAAKFRGLRAAWAHQGRLGARDRAFLHAFSNGANPDSSPGDYTLSHQIVAWERVIELGPDQPEAWYELGDVLFHAGGHVPDSRVRAAAAFRRALALDSTFAPALPHLIHLAATSGDHATLAALVPRYFASDSQSPMSGMLRWRLAIHAGRPSQPPPPTSRRS